MQGRLFISISDFQGCHYRCLHFLFQLWIYLTVVFLIVISNFPMLHVYSTCIGFTNSWIRIQNNSRSTDKGWEADMKSLSWGMNVSIYLYIQSRALVRSPDTTWEGFLILHATNRVAFLPGERWKEGFSCCLFPVYVEGAIKGELEEEIAFYDIKEKCPFELEWKWGLLEDLCGNLEWEKVQMEIVFTASYTKTCILAPLKQLLYLG